MPRKTTAQQIEEAIEAERRRAAAAALKVALKNDWCTQVFTALKALKMMAYTPDHYIVERNYTYGYGHERSPWNVTGECFYMSLDDAKAEADGYKSHYSSADRARVVAVVGGKRKIIHKVNYR